jgi:hypothetical protein
MKDLNPIVKSGIVLALLLASSGCYVVEPRSGYYDREHNRYYYEHSWRDCREHEHDEHCR